MARRKKYDRSTRNLDGSPRKRGRHVKHDARKSPYASGQERLDRFRGVDTVAESAATAASIAKPLVYGQSREKLIAETEARLNRDLDQIIPVPKSEWTPQRLAIASGLSIAQVTRVFHNDIRQQRWRQFAHDIKTQSIGYGITAEQSAKVMALASGHRYQIPSSGMLRLARAMGITVDELVDILLKPI